MRRRIDLVVLSVLSVLLGLAIGSCSKKSETETPATSTSVTPPPAAAVSVTAVELGRSVGGDKRIVDATQEFKPNDTIYASVLTTGSAPGTVVKARWTFQDGQVVNESEETIAATADAATEFHISKPDGWPAGKYQVEILLNGSPVQTKQFEVK
jgi:hypothetical protein